MSDCHLEALALAKDVAASEWHYRSCVWRLTGPQVVALASALLAEHERRVEAEQQIVALRAKLDRADCTQREGSDTRHCRVDAPCWRLAEQADARIHELEAGLREARVYVKEARCPDRYAEDPAQDTLDRIDALLARKEDR